MLTNDLPIMVIGALLFGMVIWALYNYTHPEPRHSSHTEGSPGSCAPGATKKHRAEAGYSRRSKSRIRSSPVSLSSGSVCSILARFVLASSSSISSGRMGAPKENIPNTPKNTAFARRFRNHMDSSRKPCPDARLRPVLLWWGNYAIGGARDGTTVKQGNG